MNMYTLMIRQIEQKKTKQESIELNEWIYLIQMEIKTAFSILFMLRVCAFLFLSIEFRAKCEKQSKQMIENSSQNMTACLRAFRPSTDPIEVIISTKSDRGSNEEENKV